MELSRIAELTRQDAGRKFHSIAHFLATEALWGAFDNLRKNAAVGVDGVTYADYEEHLVENLVKLHEKLKSRTYRAQPLRRIYIDKEDGKKRPISIPSLEDKIVQRATVELLNAIFEQDFLDRSYGFRPGRSAHDALDEVGRVICRGPTEYVLELDISSYFDSIAPQATHGDDRAEGYRFKHSWADRKVDEHWCNRRRTTPYARDGNWSGADHQPATFISTTCWICGSRTQGQTAPTRGGVRNPLC